MATHQPVEDITSGGDRAKLALAVALVVAGVLGYYWLADQAQVVRILSVVAGLVLGGLVAWSSGPGRRALAFVQESWNETRRVTWPSRKETWTITLYVFLFVLVMAAFLWAVDKGLEFVLYDIVLGWRK